MIRLCYQIIRYLRQNLKLLLNQSPLRKPQKSRQCIIIFKIKIRYLPGILAKLTALLALSLKISSRKLNQRFKNVIPPIRTILAKKTVTLISIRAHKLMASRQSLATRSWNLWYRSNSELPVTRWLEPTQIQMIPKQCQLPSLTSITSQSSKLFCQFTKFGRVNL